MLELKYYTMRKLETSSFQQQLNGNRQVKHQKEDLRKRWMDGIRMDLETLKAADWKDRVQYRH